MSQSNRATSEGGYREHQERSSGGPLVFAVLTFSDTRTPETDKSGQTICSLLEAAGHRVLHYAIVKDDAAAIRRALEHCLADPQIAVIVATGGTGIARRDSAYEVVSGLLEKRLDGFGELFRMLSYQEIGSGAIMSRATAGIARGKVIFSIPGSTGAVKLAVEKLILPEAGHILWEINK